MSRPGPVRVEWSGSVAQIVIDRGERRNALTDPMVRSLNQALAALADDPKVTGVIVTGVDGAFCAGADLDMVKSNTAAATEDTREYIEAEGQAIIRGLIALPVPTIAAIDGPALGLGFDLALACDSIFIGPSGWCMQAWGRLGLIDGTGGSLLLRHRNPTVLWRLLAEQPRITGSLGAELSIAEDTGERSARDVALERMHGFDHFTRDALTAYVDVQRTPIRAEIDAHLARTARVQANLLTSPEFTAAADRVLRSSRTDEREAKGTAHV
ncbi:hypothetical protein GCM10023094_11340 [Rhodococcus olei]|uniref:Enoyl-CoA hydratase/carnithine racemase n=1 Tax=Rhodococcus olei TaxID=2161675 RepID=A0ABP8NY92_9NOCA